MGSMPVWKEDGETYFQGLTILRMLGRRTGLYSIEPETAWQIDSAMELVEDQMGNYNKWAFSLKGSAFTQDQVDIVKPSIEKVC